MLRLKKAFPTSLLLLAILACGYAVYRSSAYQSCIAEKRQEARAEQQNEGHAAFVVYVDCLGRFSEEHHGPITAVATIFLALFTTTLWWATWNLVSHARKIERAYISGGGGYAGDPNTGAADYTRFVLTVQNYGKTPGTVIAYAVFVVDRENLPVRPAYLATGFKPTPFNGVYQLGVPTQGITQITVPPGPNPIAYGRLWYTDIFNDEHYFSFALPIRTPDNHALLIGISPAYTHST